jgi:hypothetical protein
MKSLYLLFFVLFSTSTMATTLNCTSLNEVLVIKVTGNIHPATFDHWTQFKAQVNGSPVVFNALTTRTMNRAQFTYYKYKIKTDEYEIDLQENQAQPKIYGNYQIGNEMFSIECTK